MTAFFASISAQTPAQATLMLGQILNAFIGLGIYSLTKAISKDWRTALIAALFPHLLPKCRILSVMGSLHSPYWHFSLALAMAYSQKSAKEQRKLATPSV